jgi:putative flippase GtrA
MSTHPVERVQSAFRDVEKRRTFVGEVLRFGAVGGVGFVLDFAVFNVFLHHGVGVLTSKAISTTVAALLTYVLNRKWSFAHRDNRGHARDLSIFLVLSTIGLGIAEACLAITHYGLGLNTKLDDNVSGVLVGTILGTLWRFYAFKRWVFTKPGTRSDEVLAASVL